MIRVLIVDDHEIVRRGLRMTILGEEDMELAGEASDGRRAVEMVAASSPDARPDVVLMDVQMPGMDGIQATALLHEQFPEVKVLMLTSFSDDAQLFTALQANPLGYLLKDTPGDELVAAIRGAAKGRPQLHPAVAMRLMQSGAGPTNPFDDLTDREQDVLKLLARGMSNKEVARALVLSEATVKSYVSIILSKLQVQDRTQAALLAVRFGLVSLDELPTGLNSE